MGRDDAKYEVSVRLARIEGHVRSIREMVEEGRPAGDVLVQFQAVRAALMGASRVYLLDHLEGCLRRATPEKLGEDAMAPLRDALRHVVEFP